MADDSPTHLRYQKAFDEEFWAGNLYPRWLSHMNQETGSPIFYVQYPAPYIVAAVVGRVSAGSLASVDQVRTLGVVASFALVLSGLTAYVWLRGIVGSAPAMFGSIVYVAAPYHLCVDLYSRAALGELFAFAWIPLCLHFVSRILENHRSAIVWFAGCFALLLTSHLFTAILFLPMVLGYTGLLSQDKIRHLCHLGAGIVLAIGLSSAYLGPLIVYRSLFNFHMLTGPNWIYSNHFLFVYKAAYLSLVNSISNLLAPLDGLSRRAEVMMLAGVVAVIVSWMVALREYRRKPFVAGGIQRRRLMGYVAVAGIAPALVIFIRPENQLEFKPLFIGNLSLSAISIYCLTFLMCPFALQGVQRRQVWFFMGSASVSLFMMCHLSASIWRGLPLLQDIQFPWRLGVFLTVAAALVVSAAKQAIDANRLRLANIVLYVAVAATLGANCVIWKIPARFRYLAPVGWTERLDPMVPVYVMSSSPTWLRTHQVMDFVQAVPHVKLLRAERASGNVTLQLRVASPAAVKVSQLYFPSWRGWIGESRLALRASEPEGFILFDVPEGSHTVVLRHERSRAELSGLAVSTGSLLLCLVWVFGPSLHHEQ